MGKVSSHDERPGGPQFPSTSWSELRRTAGTTAEKRQAALANVILRYRRPLLWHLTTELRLGEEEAEETLQAFVVGKFVIGDLPARAKKKKGKFRSYLLRALTNFVYTRSKAKRAAPLDAQAASAAGREADPSQQFESLWARQVVHEALGAVESEYRATGRQSAWELFYRRVVEPIFDGTAPPAYSALAEQFALSSAVQACNLVTTVRRAYERHLRALVAEYAEDEADIEADIHYLRKILAAGRA